MSSSSSSSPSPAASSSPSSPASLLSRASHADRVVVYRRAGIGGEPLPSLMQRGSLLISDLIAHAARYHGDVEVVSRVPELPATAPPVRLTYRQMYERVQRLAHVLVHRLGVKMGDVVGTIAFNTHRHMELYYAVSGIGAILHTINPRLFAEQLEYIVNHASDNVLFVDIAAAPVLHELVHKRNITCRQFVYMTDAAHMPRPCPATSSTSPTTSLCYETLLNEAGPSSPTFEWPSFSEHAASSLCYTSGTTGHPKGVLFSHRSTVLHSYAICMRDVLSISVHDTILVVTPLFHVNAWGIPYAACMTGAKLVFPAANMEGAALAQLLHDERCTMTFGVPTVWLKLLEYLDMHPTYKLPELDRVVIGGSAAPRSMIERFAARNVRVVHAWGMTEMSPIGTAASLLPKHRTCTDDQRIDVMMKQGRAAYGVQMKIVDDDGKELPHDGKTSGELMVRGPWITKGYFKLRSDGRDASTWDEQRNTDDTDWFRTGDVSTIDPDGFMAIVDRSKDVIKSGGEWISSIELENEACGHPGVGEAAVIGVAHDKWQERPLLIVVRKPNEAGQKLTDAELLRWLGTRVARWWVPEAVEFVSSLPHTATGKLLKSALRKQFATYRFAAPIDRAEVDPPRAATEESSANANAPIGKQQRLAAKL